MVVKIPKIEYLKLKNKYDKIKILNSIDHDLEVELYEGQLDTKNVNGKLTLALKYSKAEVGNFDQAQLDLYECTVSLGNGKKASINSKYSKWTVGSVLSLIVDAYEGTGEAGIIKGNLELKSKYYRFKAITFETANISMYEGCFTAEQENPLPAKINTAVSILPILEKWISKVVMKLTSMSPKWDHYPSKTVNTAVLKSKNSMEALRPAPMKAA